MRIITLLMWLCFMTVTTYAQDDQNNQEKGTVIEMDDELFQKQIKELEEASKEESDHIKELVAEIVPTYKYQKQ